MIRWESQMVEMIVDGIEAFAQWEHRANCSQFSLPHAMQLSGIDYK